MYPTMKHYLVLALLVLFTVPIRAQVLRITNEASGLACYSTSDLMTAHTAMGFFNTSKVELLIISKDCFIMQKHWKPKILDEKIIQGADVKMVEVRLEGQGEALFAWSLLKNFDFIGD